MRRVLVLALLLAGLISQDAFAVSETRALRLTVAGQDGSMNSFALYDKITVVVIGIDRYKALDKNYLKFAVRDAKGVEQVLRERYPVSKVITLYDEQATRDNIMKVLQGELANTGLEDAVMVYYAGHGITRTTPQGKLGYLIPYDGSLKQDEMYRNISMQQIKSDISPLIPAKHVLFVMDACFGGLLLDTRGAAVEPSHKAGYLKEITSSQARQIITAGGEDEEVLDGGLDGHSVFTGRFIEALRGNEEFLTARELGVDLQRKVYADAAAMGHKQRPLSGEIYGTGDFVFMPDPEKTKQYSEAEVSRIEAEVKALENLKLEAVKANEAEKLRQIERDQSIKDAELRQARIREENARQDEEMRKKAEDEATASATAREKESREREVRLASLRTQAERMRTEMASGGTASMSVEGAMAEVKRINEAIGKIETDFNAELEKGLAPIRQYYGEKKVKAVNQPPRDKKFETEAEYQARLAGAKKEAEALRAEQKAKEEELRSRVIKERDEQLKSLKEQKGVLLKQEFVFSGKDLVWKFEDYNPDRQEFYVSGKVIAKDFSAVVPMPKDKAKEFDAHPEVLVASATVVVTDAAGIGAKGFGLQEPGGGEFSDRGILGWMYSPKVKAALEFESAMVLVNGGCFQMGDTFGDGDRDEKPVHEVCVDDFYIGKYEVTQRQWKDVMGSNLSGCDDCPVVNVGWDDAQEYLKKLSEKTGRQYRLPTEAEWEYAARSGGKAEKYAGGSNVVALAWYASNSGDKTHPVGQKAPNGLGIYDMSGNVREWVSDLFSDYFSNSPRNNPQGPSSGFYRVLRGGSWHNSPQLVRASDRSLNGSGLRSAFVGFRSARTP